MWFHFDLCSLYELNYWREIWVVIVFSASADNCTDCFVNIMSSTYVKVASWQVVVVVDLVAAIKSLFSTVQFSA